MSDNKALWKRAFTTDPKAVKAITGKQYSGNSPKPYWIIERLTDEFGPCGIGWGFSIQNERFERFSETDTLHVAVVRFWYTFNGVNGTLEQIGQTKASYMTNAGKFMLDEDAPKKSVTDALVKCASYLGFAGDIFSGRWDDSRYVAEANKEWREREKRDGEPEQPKGLQMPADMRILPTAGAGEGLTEEKRAELADVALYMIDSHKNGKDLDAIRIYYELSENDEKVYVWKLLATESKLRALVKANSPHAEVK